MPNIQGIKKRIDSIKETRKITNAMYLISSTQMRKAKSDLDRTRPYFEALPWTKAIIVYIDPV